MGKRTFDVEVCRTSFAFARVTVDADSQAQAQESAMEVAGDHLYKERDAEYSIPNDVRPRFRRKDPAGMRLVTEIDPEWGRSAGLAYMLDDAALARIVDLAAVVKAHDLSELRHHIFPDVVCGSTEDMNGLELRVAGVNRPWVDMVASMPEGDEQPNSMAVDIKSLVEAFEDECSHFFVLDTDDLSMTKKELFGTVAPEDFQVGAVAIQGPCGLISKEEIAEFFRDRSSVESERG